MSGFGSILLLSLVTLGGLFTVAAGLIYVERRVLAIWQERCGPNRCGPAGLLQVVADMIKIFFKEDWTPPFADRPIFIAAPAIAMTASLISFSVVPVSPGLALADLDAGLLIFLGLSSVGVYSPALAGWASGSKYPLLGAMRSAGQMISYEVFLGLSLMGVVAQAGSFRMSEIVQAQRGMWFCVPQALGLVVFLVAGAAEVRRLPFDLGEAESELVAGFHSEYSGMKFAMFFLGEYVGITLLSAVIVTLFLGGWLGPVLPPGLWFALKTLGVIVLFLLMRSALPRPRYDQLMAWGWKLMLPLALLNLLVTAAIILAREGG